MGDGRRWYKQHGLVPAPANRRHSSRSVGREGYRRRKVCKGQDFQVDLPRTAQCWEHVAGGPFHQRLVHRRDRHEIGRSESAEIQTWRSSLIHSFVTWYHQLTVADAEAAPPPADDGDISDPEEDTIAGQIAMMKGQRVKKVDGDENGEEEDSSDEEGDGGSGSDSDSDSEDEAPRGKKVVVDSSDSDSD